jgi:uncharacterized membrane protein
MNMTSALWLALLAGAAMAAYSVFSRLASSGIHPALGATIITGVAFLVNLAVTVALKVTGASITATPRSLYLVMVVGLAAACADLFTLSAYANGLRVTSSFMIGGTSTALVLFVGFLVLREPFTWMKLFSVGLIAAGIFMLQREGVQ